MRSLSSTVSDTPSTWAPSRRVVSKISTESGFRSDMLHPVLVPVDVAVDGLAVLLHHGLGHGPRARHRAVVDRADRRHLGGRAAQEDLLGDVEVAAGDEVGTDVETEIAGDGHDRALGDALESTGGQRRGDELALTGD